MESLRALFETHEGKVPAPTLFQIEKLQTHFDLLREWNERMSLVSPKSLEVAFATHYCDSIHISHFAKASAGTLRKFFDVGCGAGFPGIVFAVLNPADKILLYERSEKKQAFLNEVVRQLSLSNIELHRDFSGSVSKGLFLARAVHPPEKLFEFFKKHLLDGSRFVLNLGGSTSIPMLPREFTKVAESKYSLPMDQGSRQVVVLEKVPRGTFSSKKR